MNAFNSISTAIFDVLLAPFGGTAVWQVWLSLIVWSSIFGLVAMVAFKYCSFQDAIASAKNQIKVHLYEIRLFKDDIIGVVVSTVKILLKNVLYLSNTLLPVAVMMAPMVAVLSQLEANYAFAPVEVGTESVLTVELDREVTDAPATVVTLDLPDGVEQTAPAVRTPDGKIAWRIKAAAPGDHVLGIDVGGTVVEKGWAVGGEPRKVPVLRTKSMWGFLYPGEAPLASDSPVYSAELSVAGFARGYPERELGEGDIIIIFLIVSMAVGFVLMLAFGVKF